MKNLFLLRHAKSSWDNAALGDFDRPLSKRGISNAIQLSEYIQKHSISFDLVLSSPSERTQSTLDLVLNPFDPIPTTSLKESIYHASPSNLSQLIKELDDEINNLLMLNQIAKPKKTNKLLLYPRATKSFSPSICFRKILHYS